MGLLFSRRKLFLVVLCGLIYKACEGSTVHAFLQVLKASARKIRDGFDRKIVLLEGHCNRVGRLHIDARDCHCNLDCVGLSVDVHLECPPEMMIDTKMPDGQFNILLARRRSFELPKFLTVLSIT